MPQGFRIGWLKRTLRLIGTGLANVNGWFRNRPVKRLRNRLSWCWLRMRMHRKRTQAFVLWHDQDHGSSLRDQEAGGNGTKHFLFPDRLRFYFWFAGIFGAATFLSKLPDKKTSCTCNYIDDCLCTQTFDGSSYLFHSVLPAVTIYLFVVYLMPYMIYVSYRVGVLEQLSRQLPEKFARWMLVGITDCMTSPRSSDAGGGRRAFLRYVLMVYRWMTPFCCKRSQLAIAYDGPDSRQGRLTRLAMTEFFNPKSLASKDGAFSRWIFYGLAPLWVFVLLMTFAIVTAALTGGTLVQKRDLLLLDVVWVVLAWFFFVAETPRMSRDLAIKLDDLAFLPSQIARPSTNLASVITGQTFRLVLNAAVTIIAVVYATLSALVP